MKTLTFTHNKKKYTSKSFDFEAFCLVNEGHADENIKGTHKCCAPAIEYMFDGTEGGTLLKEISIAEHIKMSRAVWDMYIEALNEAAKNE